MLLLLLLLILSLLFYYYHYYNYCDDSDYDCDYDSDFDSNYDSDYHYDYDYDHCDAGIASPHTYHVRACTPSVYVPGASDALVRLKGLYVGECG